MLVALTLVSPFLNRKLKIFRDAELSRAKIK